MEIHLGSLNAGAPRPKVNQTDELKRAPSEILSWPQSHGYIKGPIEFNILCDLVLKDMRAGSYQELLHRCIKEGHLPSEEKPTYILLTNGTFKFTTSATRFSISIIDYTQYEAACEGIFDILKVLTEHDLISKFQISPTYFPIYDHGKLIYYVIRHIIPHYDTYSAFDKNFDKFENCFKHRAKNGQLIFMFRYEDPIKLSNIPKKYLDTIDLKIENVPYPEPVYIAQFRQDKLYKYLVHVGEMGDHLGRHWQRDTKIILTVDNVEDVASAIEHKLALFGFKIENFEQFKQKIHEAGKKVLISEA